MWPPSVRSDIQQILSPSAAAAAGRYNAGRGSQWRLRTPYPWGITGAGDPLFAQIVAMYQQTIGHSGSSLDGKLGPRTLANHIVGADNARRFGQSMSAWDQFWIRTIAVTGNPTAIVRESGLREPTAGSPPPGGAYPIPGSAPGTRPPPAPPPAPPRPTPGPSPTVGPVVDNTPVTGGGGGFMQFVKDNIFLVAAGGVALVTVGLMFTSKKKAASEAFDNHEYVEPAPLGPVPDFIREKREQARAAAATEAPRSNPRRRRRRR